MSLNSVNTNIGASVALQSLNTTSSALQAAQKQISTGYRVNDAGDDGGAFAVAQNVRSDVSALTSVNQQLGNAAGLVTTSETSLTSISDDLTKAKGLLVSIGDASNSADQRDQYISTFKTLVSSVADAVDGSTYNGQTLLGAASGAVSGTSKAVINNEAGSTYTISAEDNSTTANALAALVGGTFSRSTSGANTFGGFTASSAQTAALAALASGGAFSQLETAVSNQLNQVGADSKLSELAADVQRQQDRQPERGSRLACRRQLVAGVGCAAVAADQAAAGHTGPLDRQPGATEPAQPIQVTD